MKQHTILIVDDEPKVYHALRRTLHREPYEILAAQDAEEALALMEQHAVDVVISDENMPGMTGTAFLARARQQWPDTVRFMLTGNARLDVTLHAINEAGIQRFFTKPCNEAELIVAIRDAIRTREATQAARPQPSATGPATEHGVSPAQGAPAAAATDEPGSARGPIRLDVDVDKAPDDYFEDLLDKLDD